MIADDHLGVTGNIYTCIIVGITADRNLFHVPVSKGMSVFQILNGLCLDIGEAFVLKVLNHFLIISAPLHFHIGRCLYHAFFAAAAGR